jgi:hypothetical protein
VIIYKVTINKVIQRKEQFNMADFKKINDENYLNIVGTLKELNLSMEGEKLRKVGFGENQQEVTCNQISKTQFNSPMMVVEVNGSPVAIDLKYGVAELGINKNGEQFENGQYKALKTVIEEYKAGIRVSVTAHLSRNEYATEDGEIKSYPTIYFDRVTRSGVSDEDSIEGSMVGVITKIFDEEVNEEPTGRLKVGLATLTYGGELEQFDFVVESDVARDFENAYEQNSVAQIYYAIKGNTVVTEVENDDTTGGFGKKAKKAVKGKSFTEYVIIGGEPAIDEENEALFITPQDIADGKTKRDIAQQKKIQKKLEKKSGSTTTVKGSAQTFGDSTPANLPF